MIFIIFTLFFSWIVYKFSFFQIGNLSKPFLIGVWLLKSVAAWFYCEYHIIHANGADTLGYFRDAAMISRLLFEQPMIFLELVFAPSAHYPVPEHIEPYVDKMGWWHTPQTYFIIRFHAVISLFTFQSFHTNALFFSFMAFAGIVAFARAIVQLLPEFSKFALFPLFLLPSLIFWTSGGHKESFLIFCFGFSLYFQICWFREKRFYYLLLMVLFFLGIFFSRKYIAFFVCPFLVANFLVYYTKRYQYSIVAMFWVFWLVVFAFIEFPNIQMNYLEAIQDKYLQFQTLATGNTHFELAYFETGLLHILSRFPESFFNSFLRPSGLIGFGLWQTITALENIGIVLIILICIFYFDRSKLHPYLINLLIYSALVLILLGFIVPNAGAIVRYRIIIFPLFVLFFSLTAKDKLYKYIYGLIPFIRPLK
ncbi:MAG: hypothetical protein EA412_13760 [Chitinophagaceae bacterium]|nr:MAG: hypothetical protein EA412_13760 [Chitinophagaceae bacterium]